MEAVAGDKGTMKVRTALILLAALLPAAASAQSINRELVRYQLRQADCRDAFAQRVASNCDARCRVAAETRRDRCLAGAERRYVQALRVQLRPPDLR